MVELTITFFISIERLILTNFADYHLPTFLAYRCGPNIAQYQEWDPNITEKEAQEFINS